MSKEILFQEIINFKVSTKMKLELQKECSKNTTTLSDTMRLIIKEYLEKKK